MLAYQHGIRNGTTYKQQAEWREVRSQDHEHATKVQFQVKSQSQAKIIILAAVRGTSEVQGLSHMQGTKVWKSLTYRIGTARLLWKLENNQLWHLAVNYHSYHSYIPR